MKKRIMVCGIGFGKYYIRAVLNAKAKFELVGIISKGSKKSKMVAEKLGIPLYDDVNKVDKSMTDIVAVVVKSGVVGGVGTEIAVSLLEKGIHVIQEQPLHVNDYKRCFKAAKKNHCVYMMNMFYPNLEAERQFIQQFKKIKTITDVTYVKAETSVQVLFPLLATLSELLEGIMPNQFEVLKGELSQRFKVINGSIKDVPLTLLVDNQMDLNEPESNMSMFHRIEIGTKIGTLLLTDSHGTVLWIPVLHEELKKIDKTTNIEIENIEAQTELVDGKIGTLGDIMKEKWPKSIQRSLECLYERIEKSDDEGDAQQILAICNAWSEIGNLLGAYDKVSVRLELPKNILDYLKKENYDEE